MNSERTLKAVVARSEDLAAFAERLPNFLDEFYLHPDPSLIEEEPPLVSKTVERGYIIDAYSAATAEALAQRYSFRVPEWVHGSDRVSRKPFFTMNSPAGRAFVLAYTPPAFKARQLFVGPEPLSRV